MNQITVTQDAGEIIENVIAKGDLAKLTPQERTRYYTEVCKSIGVNPLTRPFEYIILNGKMTLYALRACTDQLRSLHGVSVEEVSDSEREGVYIVTAKVKNRDGRTDISKGAVNIAGLKGEALANALMKAETKAKRRATLSICGLGWLDETEVEAIPSAVRPESGQQALPASEPASDMTARAKVYAKKAIARCRAFTDGRSFDDWHTRNRDAIAQVKTYDPALHGQLLAAIADCVRKFPPSAEPDGELI